MESMNAGETVSFCDGLDSIALASIRRTGMLDMREPS